jgi:hypothetical protein
MHTIPCPYPANKRERLVTMPVLDKPGDIKREVRN